MGCLSGGVYPGGVYPGMQWGRHPPCGQTDTCQNINFRKLHLRSVIKLDVVISHINFILKHHVTIPNLFPLEVVHK